MTGSDFPPLDAAASPAAVLARIEAAGIVGMGGGGHPTASKLRAAMAGKAGWVIGNGMATEPGAGADIALLREHAEAVVSGLHVVRRCLAGGEAGESPVREVRHVLAVPAGSGIGPPATPVVLGYPAGDERRLAAHLTGREVPQGARPTDVGILVLNVATLFAIHEAVWAGRALRRRLVAVGGAEHWIALGTPLETLRPLLTPSAGTTAAAPPGSRPRSGRDEREGEPGQAQGALRVGGPLTGRNAAPGARVDAATFQVDAPLRPADPCIRCGWCQPACPEGLAPEALHWAFEAGADAAPAADCSECGACTAACPSGIDLVNEFRALKAGQRRAAVQARRAAAAGQRSTARAERLRQAADARRDRRAARLRQRREW